MDDGLPGRAAANASHLLHASISRILVIQVCSVTRVVPILRKQDTLGTSPAPFGLEETSQLGSSALGCTRSCLNPADGVFVLKQRRWHLGHEPLAAQARESEHSSTAQGDGL